MMPLLAVHVLVVEFWFGALLPLALIAVHEPPAVAARIVERFSRVAAWLVPLIFVAGLLIALELLPDPGALGRPYEWGLILKVAVFSVLMGLAAINKWRLGPALIRGDPGSRLNLQRSIAIEFALIVLVLMGTAILTTFWSPMH